MSINHTEGESLKTIIGYLRETFPKLDDAILERDIKTFFKDNYFDVYQDVEHISLKSNVLRIIFKSSAMASDFMLKRNFIIEAINKNIGKEAIKEILVSG